MIDPLLNLINVALWYLEEPNEVTIRRATELLTDATQLRTKEVAERKQQIPSNSLRRENG